MSDSSRDPVPLPSWFERPKSAFTQQLTLFASKLPEVLATLQVSVDDLARWHQLKWVSFGPDRSMRLQPWEVDEIRFVRDVVRSGLSDAQIECLLEQLPRPLNFDADRVAYSFQFGWVAAVQSIEPDPDEIVDQHLEDWLDGLDVESNQGRLIDLRDRINTLLNSDCIDENGPEENELKTT